MVRIAKNDFVSELGTEFLDDTTSLEELFGAATRFYVPLIRQIIPRAFRVEYEFEDTRVFEEKARDGVYGPEDMNRIVWREILLRAHLVVSASLYRTCRLLDATAREYRASNLPGWASCTRALLEAVGDSSDALRAIPGTLAEHHIFIRGCLSGRQRELSGSTELEERLIHFSHARKLKSGEKDRAPPSHEAKSAIEYIRQIGTPEALTLYGELCEYSHPAASSVEYLFSGVGEGSSFRVDPSRDEHKIESLIRAYRTVLEDVLMIGFNPILLSLRVFHTFKVFPNIPELRDVNFSTIPAWATIERQLRKR